MGFLGDTIGKVTGGMDVGGVFKGIFQGISIILGFMVVACIIAVIGYIWWNSKRYSRKIIIAKRLGGKHFFAGNDTARIAKIGDMGNEILYLRKLKVFRATNGILVNNNTYLFTIDEQGNWDNVGLSDINLQKKEIMFELPSSDSRLANVSIRRLNEKQFEKKQWWKENVALIAGGMILVVIVIFLFLMANKYFTIFDTQKLILEEQQKTYEANTKTVEAMTKLAETISNLVGGAQFKPVAQVTTT